MAYMHHGSIRKYTAALLDTFNSIEVQYKKSDGQEYSKDIPIKYSTREKSRVLDDYTVDQLLHGNQSVLPRATLALSAMNKAEQRVTNKNNKINRFKTGDTIEYSFNSVPFEFAYEINIQCRGMNEATQIIEQIVPMFNPTVNIDIWDVSNLDEPTRVPVRLNDVSFESEDYSEISSNIITVTLSLSLIGNLYPPIKSGPLVNKFKIYFNEIEDAETASRKELLSWDVDHCGTIDLGSEELSGANVVELFVTDRTLIQDNQIILPKKAYGDILFNYAMIFDNLEDHVMFEVTCSVESDGKTINFDPLDEVEGKYAVVSYISSSDV